MSEKFTPRADDWDEKKAQHEAAQFDQAVYGNAGTTLFTDRAKKRAETGDAYVEHMANMSERPDDYDSIDDGRTDSVDRDIQADARLRRAAMIAKNIRELGSQQVQVSEAEAASQRYADLQDKLNDLLVSYDSDATIHPVQKEEIINRIIDMTAGENGADKSYSDNDSTPGTEVRELTDDSDSDEDKNDADEHNSVDKTPEESDDGGKDEDSDEADDSDDGSESEKGPDSEGKELILHPGVNPEQIAALHDAREEFLQLCAKEQKGHLRHVKPGGRAEVVLRSGLIGKLGGNKLADWLSKPSKESERLGLKYSDALKAVHDVHDAFLERDVTNEKITEEQMHALKVQRSVNEYAEGALRIAEIQKSDAKKPMNKWLRRAGYAGAGVVGGLIMLTPLGWGGGLLAAGSGAAALRIAANKRNALTESKDGLYQVDQVAEANIAYYQDEFNDEDLRHVVYEHQENVRKEVGKNRNRLTAPVFGTAVLALATKYGLDNLMTRPDATHASSIPKTESGNNPTDITDQPHGSGGSDLGPNRPETPGAGVGSNPSGSGAETGGVPNIDSAYVEYGSGEIRETRQLLEQLGFKPEGNQAEQVYRMLGEDIFSNDPNYRGPTGDLRIGASGTYNFRPGFVEAAYEAAKSLGIK